MYLRAVLRNTNDSQISKAVRTDQHALCERIESFLLRLEIWCRDFPVLAGIWTLSGLTASGQGA
jgi:hypothetical protein